jgi:Uma2 family endonuclease
MSAQPKTSMTVEEYLRFEATSEYKHEYVAGHVVALAGGNEQHVIISGNVYASLHAQLRKRDCIVYNSDMKVKIEYTGLYTYPDIAVVCGAARFADTTRQVLLNPVILIEVLSPSTERYDRGKKFQNYRTMASLQEYILIAQDAPMIDQYIRQPDNLWLLSSTDDVRGTITLPSIQCTLELEDVYEKVRFQPEADTLSDEEPGSE